MATRPKAAIVPAAKPAPVSALAQRPEICLLSAVNGWIIYDAAPGLPRRPILVAESPAQLAEIVEAWAAGRAMGEGRI